MAISSRMLIVDDDPFLQDIIASWLRGAGYECVLADCAAAVWTQLKRQPVDLVTLDIRMPDCSGLDLLDGIKQEFPDTAVLMVTGEGESSQAVRALTHGAFGYLSKPLDREELLAQVHSGLEHRRLIIENREYLQGLEKLVSEQTRVIREAHEETIHRLVSASMYRDEETGAHIRRTGLYSELLAATAGWAPELIDQIRLAAPMHDVGKIGIPDAILCKPGKLTAREFAIMQKHAQLGAQMLSGSQSPVLCMARDIALGHHERWDGKGYPAGLKGVEIPESARIVAIVDVFDALTHDRVYRPALEPSEVLKIMQAGRGTQFDPRLFDIFWSLLPEMNAVAQTILDSDAANNKLNLSATDLIVSVDANAATQWGHTAW
jgi:putative two-component system response regulator